MEKQLPSINDNSTVKEYLSLLLNQGYKKEHSETKELLEYIEQIEKQYNDIVDELQEVKSLLSQLQNPATKSRLTQAVEKTEKVIESGLKKLNDVKLKLVVSMKDSIHDFKKKGKSGVIKTVNVFHFKDALRGVRKSLFFAMKKTEVISQTCDQITSEMRQAKSHLKSIGHIMIGKTMNDSVDKYKVNLMQKGIRIIHSTLQRMVIKTTSILHKIEDFEKPSVKGEIKMLSSKSNNIIQKTNKPDRNTR